jgi:hypothetical protein
LDPNNENETNNFPDFVAHYAGTSKMREDKKARKIKGNLCLVIAFKEYWLS